jgi:hypothetical protein
MTTRGTPLRGWLAAAVVVHLVISLVHGAAHAQAHVPLSRGGTLFVFIVILAGPLVGLALTWPAERLGNWLIALTMAGSLASGVVNHFVLDSADHVAHVQPEWRVLFAATAVLLALTELLGSGLAIGVLRARTSS